MEAVARQGSPGSDYNPLMVGERVRLRILIGSLSLVFGLAIYGLAVMGVAVAVLPRQWIVQTLFYAAAGIAWVWPAAWLTRWMQQAEPHRPPPAG